MTTIKLRRGTTAQWATANPVLAAGEPGVDTTTGLLGIGNGTTAWADLPKFLDQKRVGDAIAASRAFVKRAGPVVPALFAGTEARYVVFRQDVGSTKGIWLGRYIGAGLWDCYELRQTVSAVSGHTTTQLRNNEIRTAGATFEADGSTNVTSSGTWTSFSTGSASGGAVVHASVNTAYKEFTPPAADDPVQITLRIPIGPNVGYSAVNIDGSRTRAKLLPTAQDEVTAGRLDASALIANGGTLNPDQRVYDGYRNLAGLNYANYVTVVDDLTAAEAGVTRFFPTGYKQAASSATRAYIDTFTEGRDGSAAQMAASSDRPLIKAMLDQSSVYEYALRPNLGTIGGWDGWVGNSHGYDSDTSVTVLVDGQTKTMATNGDAYAGSSIVLVRKSNILHPGTGDTIGRATCTYSLTLEGLAVSVQIEWLTSITFSDYSYLGMMPRNASFTRARNFGLTSAVSATAGDGSIKADAPADAMACWDGPWASLWRSSDTLSTVRDYPDTTRHLWYEDRNNLLRKIYPTRTSAAAPETVVNGTYWRAGFVYASKKIAEADALLSAA